MENAYNGLLEVMDGIAREAQRQSVYTGIVRSVSPLTVETGGVLLSGGDLLVNAQLLPQSTAKTISGLKGSIRGRRSGCSEGGQSAFNIEEGSAAAVVTRAGLLTVGCRVALVTADHDKFILLCRVVEV